MTKAFVVGSGPNGLAAAIELARAGVEVTVLEARTTAGGGMRSETQTMDGLVHDDCSAFHPLALASPFFRSLDLARHGLSFCHSDVVVAHPLGGGRAGAMWRDLDETVADMAGDGAAWRRLFEPLIAAFPELVGDVLGPIVRIPGHPLRLARFGLRSVQPATMTVRRWHSPETRALFGGIAAHIGSPLGRPLSSAVGLLLGAAGHAEGWPVARGGSQSIVDALVAELTELGGVVETGVVVGNLAELGGAEIVMLDVAPRAAVRIAGDRLPARVASALRRFRYGPAAFKLDLAIDGDVPWQDPHSGRAGVVHVGGTFEEVAHAERSVAKGAMPVRPFVLVGQQYLADRSRSSGAINPLWLYAHVPAGYRGDATDSILAQVERFAPGFRERILASHVRDASALERYNANYVGGDIGCGANTWTQLVMRPRITVRPYELGIDGVYLCSAATPPGAGVHGMCGANAARVALRR